MTLAELIARIEGRFTCVDGLPTAISQTGQPYRELRSGGGRCEADVASVLWDEFADYAADKCGTLYWRCRPETGSVRHAGRGRQPDIWTAYARLLISDKPVIYPDLAALDAARAGRIHAA